MADLILDSLLREELKDFKRVNFTYPSGSTTSLKLDLMENPYSPPPLVEEMIMQAVQKVQINRYPRTDYQSIANQIKHINQLPDDAGLLLGNGASELILTLCMAFSSRNKIIMRPSPSFYLYKRAALLAGKTYIDVPLRADFQLDVNVWIENIAKYQPELIFIANPNNPTANLFQTETLIEICKHAKGVVVIDEVFYPYSQYTMLDYLAEFNNLIIMRSFSKIGLGGLRVGYIIAKQEIINYLSRLMLPFMLNEFSLVALECVLANYTYIDVQIKQIIKQREQCIKRFKHELSEHVHAFQSDTNFILLKINHGLCQKMVDFLRTKNIYIQLLDAHRPLLQDCVRFSIGTAAENEIFIQAVKSFFEGVGKMIKQEVSQGTIV